MLHCFRYRFKNEKKVGIKEIGPRFTLKLRSLQMGTFDSKFGEYEWVHKVKYRLTFSKCCKIILSVICGLVCGGEGCAGCSTLCMKNRHKEVLISSSWKLLCIVFAHNNLFNPNWYLVEGVTKPPSPSRFLPG